MNIDVICLKKNGKIKLVHNQFELNSLDKEKYDAYLIQVGMFSSVFKAMKPGSGWLKPIKKIRVIYGLDRYIEGSFQYYNDSEDDSTSASIAEYGVIDLEFNDILDFIYFIVSLEKMASLNIMGNGGFGHVVYLTDFRMEYQRTDGKEIEFTVPKRLRKRDQMKNYGFCIPTLIKALMDFFDDAEASFTNPEFYGKKYAYISPDLKSWDYKPRSDRDLVTIPMVQSGCCTLVASFVFTLLDTLKYMGQIDLTIYTCMEEEHNLPFDVPLTADTVSYYSPEYFDIYDNFTYKIITAQDIIEMAAMLPYYIKTLRDFGNLSSDEVVKMEFKERSIIAQLKLWSNSREDIPLKHIVYEKELEEMEMDESTNRFIKYLITWINKPVSLDGLSIDDMWPF